jgi:hypothetical protein
MVCPIALARHGFALDLIISSAAYDQCPTTDAVADPGNRFPIEGVLGAACFDNAYAM